MPRNPSPRVQRDGRDTYLAVHQKSLRKEVELLVSVVPDSLEIPQENKTELEFCVFGNSHWRCAGRWPLFDLNAWRANVELIGNPNTR